MYFLFLSTIITFILFVLLIWALFLSKRKELFICESWVYFFAKM